MVKIIIFCLNINSNTFELVKLEMSDCSKLQFFRYCRTKNVSFTNRPRTTVFLGYVVAYTSLCETSPVTGQ